MINTYMNHTGPTRRDADQESLYQSLTMSTKKVNGEVITVPTNTVDNYLRIFFYDNSTKIFKRNSFTGKIERIDVTPKREWQKSDSALLKAYIEKYYNLSCSSKFNDAFSISIQNTGYNPILQLIEKGAYDGRKHCESFFIDFLGAEDSEYNREVSRLIFGGAIHRLMDPGCKWDFMPVLIGKQGSGKSTIIRWLALDDNYYSSVKTIKSKRGLESINSVWICELEELMALRQVDAEEAKAFISTASDYYRGSYERDSSQHPRKCVLIGSTNSVSVISDTTGARRFLPLQVNSNGADLFAREAEIKEEIRQCYKEMLKAYLDGSPLCNPLPSTTVEKQVEAMQEEIIEDDWRVGVIGEYLKGKTYICLLQLKREALSKYGGGSVPDKDSRELADILVSKFGCKRGSTRNFGAYGKQKSFIIPRSLSSASRSTSSAAIPPATVPDCTDSTITSLGVPIDCVLCFQ